MNRLLRMSLVLAIAAAPALSACAADAADATDTGAGDVATGSDDGDTGVPGSDAPVEAGRGDVPDDRAADVEHVEVPEPDAPIADGTVDAPEVAAADLGVELQGDVAPDVPADGVEDVPAEAGPDVTDDAVTPGACVNPDDSEILGSDPTAFQGTLRQCSLDCANSPDRVPCITACVAGGTGLSGACATCFAQGEDCMFTNCLMTCLGDPEGDNCIGCREMYCAAALEACSGMTAP